MSFSFGSISSPVEAAATTPGGTAGFSWGGAGAGVGSGTFGSASFRNGASYPQQSALAPSPSGSFAFSGIGGASAFPSSAVPAPQQSPPQLRIPSYADLFHGNKWRKLIELAEKVLRKQYVGATAKANANDNNMPTRNNNSAGNLMSWEAQELSAGLHEQADQLIHACCAVPQPVEPNQALRQYLLMHSSSEIVLNGKPAILTASVVQKMIQVSDHLRIKEEEALALLAHQKAQITPSCSNHGDSVEPSVTTCINSWWEEQRLPLQTCLRLVQYRLESADLIIATDALLNALIPAVIAAIPVYTSWIHAWRQQLQQQQSDSDSVKKNPFIVFATDQRAGLCNILFFLAYQTQWNAVEVASLIDLVRELSNQLKVLDPFEDVPSPFQHEDDAPIQQQKQQLGLGWESRAQAAFTVSGGLFKEKDSLQWQQELVKMTLDTCQPDLLKCVSVLITTVISTLDSGSELLDRETHTFHTFGTGNRFVVPFNENSLKTMIPIHTRLSTSNARNDWHRLDIWGVLSASYALLLQSALSPASSSTSYLHSPPLSIHPIVSEVGDNDLDFRKSWRGCLEAPTELKSFTFARLGLVPALLSLENWRLDKSSTVNTTEFVLSVVARFVSRYLEVLCASDDLPISRKKWEQDAEEDLRLRRTHHEQKRQFQVWSGTNDDQVDNIPLFVDLMQRPDCMDDVVALASEVAAVGPEFSSLFWFMDDVETEGNLDTTQLIPSCTLVALDRLQEEDESLLPSFLSFLAALALANGGADAVNLLLSGSVKDGRKSQLTWYSIMETLRWYTQELRKSDFSGPSVKKTTSTEHTSTSYYYVYEDTNSNPQSLPSDSLSEATVVRDLSDASAFVLSSLLNVVATVCRFCPAARATLLDTISPNLGPGPLGSAEVMRRDSTLTILFDLATAPLPMDIRGSVFTTLSALLTVDPSDVTNTRVREASLSAWYMLDQSRIFPVELLDQYSSIVDKDVTNSKGTGLSFPPASTSLVVERAHTSWIPPDPVYSILYELEYVESTRGVYPSTEGFLRLLRTLFTAGSPSDLGSNTRVRCGCTPYIEYVTHLVLPRAVGTFHGASTLPFRSNQDRNRLIALALGVVDVTLTKYQVHTSSLVQPENLKDKYDELRIKALGLIGLKSLANEVVSKPTFSEACLYAGDWHTVSGTEIPSRESQIDATMIQSSALSTAQHNQEALIPRPKSPALSVLIDLLHSSVGQLFNTIMRLLKNNSRTPCDLEDLSCTYALFNDTRPSVYSSKLGFTSSTGRSLQNFLVTLQGDPEIPFLGNSIVWMERATHAALKVLCTAMVHEDELLAIGESLKGGHTIVPMLSFRKRKFASSRIETSSIHLSTLSQLLISSNATSNMLSLITDLIGYESMNDVRDVMISRSAAAIILYVDRSIGFRPITTLYRTIEEGSLKLAHAFGNRLVISGSRVGSDQDAELVSVILNHMLIDLRKTVFSQQSITNTLLGFRMDMNDTPWTKEDDFSNFAYNANCFTALLHVLCDDSFACLPITSETASMGYEVFARLMTISRNASATKRALLTSGRLRHVDFWRSHLTKLLYALNSSKPCNYIYHSLAWLLKSLSCELTILQGATGDMPQLSQLESILTYLYSPPSNTLSTLICLLPLKQLEIIKTNYQPKDHELKKIKLSGAAEVVKGFEILDCSGTVNCNKVHSNPEDIAAWCRTWNEFVSRDCATAHLSCAVYQLTSTLPSDSKLLLRFSWLKTSLCNILSEVLSLMNDPQLNSNFYTAATRNLSLAALFLAHAMVDRSCLERSTEEIMKVTSACNLATLSIVSSFDMQDDRACDSMRQERTVLLCTVLALLIDSNNFDFENSVESFFEAAYVHARLSCCALLPSNQTRIARACLCLVLEKICFAAHFSQSQSSLQRILFRVANGSSFMSALLGLVTKLDSYVIDLLLKITLLPAGSQVLIAAGIFDALSKASDAYRIEEALAMQAALNSSFGTVLEVGVPPFFLGHLELFLALASESDDGGQRKQQVTACGERLIANYDMVFRRIIDEFPTDFSSVNLVSRFFGLFAMSHEPAVSCSRCFEGAQSTSLSSLGAAQRSLLFLSFQIASNPLPSIFLPQIPTAIFSSLTLKDKSWWDSVELGSNLSFGSAEMAQEICSYAAAALSIAKVTIWSVLFTSSAFNFDDSMIACCLCRCQDALQVIEASPYFRQQWVDANVLSHADVQNVKALIGNIIEEMMILLLQRVRRVAQGEDSLSRTFTNRDAAKMHPLKTIVQVTLDHCSESFGAFRLMNRPEKHRYYESELEKALRHEVKSL